MDWRYGASFFPYVFIDNMELHQYAPTPILFYCGEGARSISVGYTAVEIHIPSLWLTCNNSNNKTEGVDS